MDYELKSISFCPYQIQELKHSSGAFVQLIPGLGTSLHDVVLVKESKPHSIHRSDGDYEKFKHALKPGFNGSFLAPFPNRLADGKFTWKNKEYQFPFNDFGRPNALHGFAFDRDFKETKNELSNGMIRLTFSYRGELPYYPFPFNLTNRFQLKSDSLLVVTEVQNTGDSEIPFGTGWHPYFDLGKKVDHLQLRLPCDSYYEVNENLIPVSKGNYTRFQQLEKIETTELDTCFKLSETEGTTILRDNDSGFQLEIKQENPYGYLQVYIPEDRMSIAIEPMTCMPDAFNNGEGLEVISPGRTLKTQFEIRIS